MERVLDVVIADDHKLLLQSFASVLQSFEYVHAVTMCSNYDELKQALSINEAQVLFLDLHFPPNDGLSICKELRAVYPNLYIIILTSYTERLRIDAARTCGANGYFIKSVDIEAVDRHLRMFLKGEAPAFITEGMGTESGEGQSYIAQLPGYNLLTPRERQVVELLIQGKDHTYISPALNISYDTYKTHRANILAKLAYKTTAELIAAVANLK